MTETDRPLYFFDITTDKLKEIITSSGQPAFRSNQILDWAYKRLAPSFDDMTDIPVKLRESIKKTITYNRLTPLIDKLSKDGWTRKLLFNLPDNSQIETVLMGYNERRTACISTQAGCGLGCTFCATGQAGLQRNITSGEIVEQVLYIARWLREKDEKLTNIVYMGMGEPFANYREVIKSLKCITSEDGFSFGSRRITVSTVGLVPQIYKFAEEDFQVNLAISLHAATNELRNTMLPINKKYPLDELIPACRDYTQKTGRRISFEWALIDNVNDTEEQAKLLVKLIKGMLCHVNLIPLNPTQGFAGSKSKQERIVIFRNILTKHGIPNTLRVRRGIDINAGCGQLRQEIQKI
jgi:23S rRNA (adenine2503-C2)-methyltransferase